MCLPIKPFLVYYVVWLYVFGLKFVAWLVHRLRGLLQSEEQQYMSEMASKKETVLERQARMRERAKSLRDKRETERLKFVENKLDQRWRSHIHVCLLHKQICIFGIHTSTIYMYNLHVHMYMYDIHFALFT